MSHYTQLSEKERGILAALLQDGKKQKEISSHLGRSPSTISRELRRNKTMIGIKNNNNPTAKKYLENSYYFPDKAQQKYLKRRKESKQQCPLKSLDLYDYVISQLKKGNTPELISGRAKKDKVGSISHECIYQFIYGKDGKHLKLWEYLPRSRKKRRKQNGRKGRRSLIPNRIDITQRPKEIETREEFGHWEGDSIVGLGTGAALHTQIERKTRLIRIRKIDRKTADLTSKAMIDIFKDFPKYARRSSTEDNGSEFTKWEEVAEQMEMDIYFATPYHSWERGSNERGNGLIRRFFPKKTNFDLVSEKDIQDIEDWINNRPMKCLQYKTPLEAFQKQILLAEHLFFKNCT